MQCNDFTRSIRIGHYIHEYVENHILKGKQVPVLKSLKQSFLHTVTFPTNIIIQGEKVANVYRICKQFKKTIMLLIVL